jgi:hypothetical protein
MNAAQAQYEPVIALSGRAGVPVVIHGRDATGAVVEGDWGLARPGAPVTVIDPGPFLMAVPPRGAYFPADGRRPGYGRYEIDHARPLRPAERYHRSWSAGGEAPSDARAAAGMLPADVDGALLTPRRRPKHHARGHR